MIDRNSEIIRLWNANNSATMIAVEMKVTRNVVIGVITRARAAGLITKPIIVAFTKRNREQANRTQPTPRPKREHAKLTEGLMIRAPIRYAEPNSPSINGLALIELEHNQCRFPTSRFQNQHYFCGAVTRDHRTSYCAEHHEKVFVKKRKLTPAEIIELKKMQSLKQWLSGAQR